MEMIRVITSYVVETQWNKHVNWLAQVLSPGKDLVKKKTCRLFIDIYLARAYYVPATILGI